MSRIIVKNLHKRVTENELQKAFAAHGEITDLQLKYTRAGVFRGFGFIGYSGAQNADDAIKALNSTYIGATKICVEHCAGLGSRDKPRGWSRYASDSSAFAKANNNSSSNGTGGDHNKQRQQQNKITRFDELQKDDPEFREFLSVHGLGGTQPVWCDEPLSATAASASATDKQRSQKSAAANMTLQTSEANNRNSSAKNKLDDDQSSEASSSDTDDAEAANVAHRQPSGAAAGAPHGQPLSSKKSAAKVAPAIRRFQIDFTAKISNLPMRAKKRYVRQFLAPLKPKSLRLPPKIKGIAFVGFLSEKELNQALNKNRTYHEGRCLEVRRHVERKSAPLAPAAGANGTGAPAPDSHSSAEPAAEPVGETGRIFVRNLPQCTTEEQLSQLFSKYGELVELHLPVDRYSRKLKGFAFVGFMFPENAERAYTELDGSVFLGRMLHLIPARPRVAADEDGDEVSGNYKEQKERQLKRQAVSGHNWNTLFLGANTVAELVAAKYDTSKKEVLSSERPGASAAVRLALGETQLLAETRAFLQQHGVQLDVFAQPAAARSQRVLLAKNLPAHTVADTLREKFAAYGRLGRLVLPPSGVTALIEFEEPSEARAAFRALAYSRLGSAPLYLEWAPTGVLAPMAPTADVAPSTGVDTAPPDTSATTDTARASESLRDVTDSLDQSNHSALFTIDRRGDGGNYDAADTAATADSAVPTPDQDGCVLFVKNISFATSDDALLQHFSRCGRVLSATVSRRARDKAQSAENQPANNQQQLLSRGYGFVNFASSQCAQQALKQLQLSQLDGHSLQLKVSNRTVRSEVKAQREKQTASKQKSSKIIVKNLPFQASKKEVVELFKTFGELSAVRLPQKLSDSDAGHHRGFAFVEYSSRHDAKRAFAALCSSTHLYGRRLVLDWASTLAADDQDTGLNGADGDNIDALRQKTAAQYASISAPSKKRLKMDDGDFEM